MSIGASIQTGETRMKRLPVVPIALGIHCVSPTSMPQPESGCFSSASRSSSEGWDACATSGSARAQCWAGSSEGSSVSLLEGPFAQWGRPQHCSCSRQHTVPWTKAISLVFTLALAAWSWQGSTAPGGFTGCGSERTARRQEA